MLETFDKVDENELFDEQFDDIESSLCKEDDKSPFISPL